MTPRRMSRRQALGSLGTVSLGGLLAACGADGGGRDARVTTTDGATGTVEARGATTRAMPELFDASAGCELSTELTEGPYFFDVDAIRRDITEDREGTPLRLALRVRDAERCAPVENAVVDVWHCDALGRYSGFEAASRGQGGPGRGGGPTDEETYLRGAQVTNGDGIVEFTTIYPGRYRGRTTHIHCKVHLDRATLLTTQLFTTREMDERVHARTPYAEAAGREVFNEDDAFYDERLELTLSEDGDGVLGVMTFDVRRA